MIKYDAVFFDLDGTLSESGEGILSCVRKTVRDLNIVIPDGFVLDSFIGPPLADSFRRLGLDEERAALGVKTYKSYYNSEGKYMNRAYDGIRELLEQLHADGCKLGVATSKYEVFARQIIENIGLSPYFDFVSGASADASRQKKLEVLSYSFEKLGVSPKSSVLIGDTRFDAEGARLSGCDFVGVLYGYGTREEMEAEGAVSFAETPGDIKAFLSR